MATPNAREPAFPSSTKDRERGRFRPGAEARETIVAVAGDDGLRLGLRTEELLSNILLEQKITNAHLAALTGDVRDESDIPIEVK